MTRGRIALALVSLVVLVLAVAVLLGALWQWFLSGDLGEALPEGARLLFFFMDIGLAVWVIALIVLAVRGRALPGFGATLLWAFVGTVVNAIVVLIVGFAQGGWAALFVLFAIEAGIAFLLAVLLVTPLVRRVAVRPAP